MLAPCQQQIRLRALLNECAGWGGAGCSRLVVVACLAASCCWPSQGLGWPWRSTTLHLAPPPPLKKQHSGGSQIASLLFWSVLHQTNHSQQKFTQTNWIRWIPPQTFPVIVENVGAVKNQRNRDGCITTGWSAGTSCRLGRRTPRIWNNRQRAGTSFWADVMHCQKIIVSVWNKRSLRILQSRHWNKTYSMFMDHVTMLIGT